LKALKTTFAVLFSVLLIATQTVFTAKVAADKTKASCCSERACCCATPENSVPASQPAAPTRTISQTDWQTLAALAQQILQQPILATQKISPAHFPLSSVSAVSLYERDCSFLI